MDDLPHSLPRQGLELLHGPYGGHHRESQRDRLDPEGASHMGLQGGGRVWNPEDPLHQADLLAEVQRDALCTIWTKAARHRNGRGLETVSYTHLTLPTILRV